MKQTVLYGIKNCDTVRKARRWLDKSGIAYQFHDFREQGLERDKLGRWLEKAGVESLINKRSATWKKLSEAERESIASGNVIEIALSNPTLIKRPVLESGGQLFIGFNEAHYKTLGHE